MIDAIVGSVIVVAATTGLLLAVEVSNRAMSDAGRHPLSQAEREMLRSAGLDSSQEISALQSDLDSLFR